MMSEGSSRLPPTRLKREKIEKRYRSITSERNIVPGVISAMDAHRKSVRLVKRLLKDTESEIVVEDSVLLQPMTMAVRRDMNEMVVEGNSVLLEQMTMAVKRDMKVLKILMRMGFGKRKDMKKMKKQMIKVKVEGVEEAQEHEGEGRGAKPEEEEGKSGGDDASRLCANFMEDEEEDKEVDSGDDESDLNSSDTDNEALRLRKCIKEDDYTYCPSGEDKVDYRKWARYYKQIRQSQGFDIDDFPGHCLNTHIIPLQNLEEDQKDYLEMIRLATNALNAFNSEKGKRYEFHKLVSVNYHKLVSVNHQAVGSIMYFVTFEARNPEAAYATKTFQTKIYCHGSDEAEVKFCRIKKSFS